MSPDTTALARGATLLELNRPDEAVAVLRQAVAEDPNDVHAACQLALALIRSDRHDEGLEVAENAAALDPEEEWAHRLRALALTAQGKAKAAVGAASEAVRLAPESASAHIVLAEALGEQGRKQQAYEAALRARELDPSDADVHATLGTLALAQKRWEDAEQHFEKALELDPEDALTHNNYGVMLLRAGSRAFNGSDDQRRRAQEHFEIAGRLDPRLDLARENLSSASGLNAMGPFGFFALWIAAYIAFRAIASGSEAAYVLVPIAVAVLAAVAIRRWRRTRAMSPAARAVLGDRTWAERLDLDGYWVPWFLLIPSPLYFALFMFITGAFIANTEPIGTQYELGPEILAWLAGLALLDVFTAWRAKRYLKRRGWWPGPTGRASSR